MVEIFYNHQRIATHFRNRRASGYTTKKEHLPSLHQHYLGWQPKLFIDKAKNIGPNTEQYIKRLFKQPGHSETKYRTAMGLVQLIKNYEKQRIERACKIGMIHPKSSYQRVVGILEKKIDMQQDLFEYHEQQQINHIPEHENIRGEDYYLEILKIKTNESND